MNYNELAEQIASLTPEQREQQVAFFKEDEETPLLEVEIKVSTEDIYWESHGSCLGNLEQAQKEIAEDEEDWEEIKEDLIIIPAGTVTIHAE